VYGPAPADVRESVTDRQTGPAAEQQQQQQQQQ
jgi:hypothetical protein